MPTTSDYGGIPQTASPASNSGQQIVIMAMWSSEPPESHDHDRARGGRRAARCAKPGKYVETAAPGSALTAARPQPTRTRDITGSCGTDRANRPAGQPKVMIRRD